MKLLLNFILTVSLALAQSPVGWLNSVLSSEEHLIHREQIGPYLVSGDSVRLIDDPYLKLDIRHNGERIPANSTVQVDATLEHRGERGGELSRTRYHPKYDGASFVIDPLELPGAENWSADSYGWLELNLMVNGPAGRGEGKVAFGIYPPKPETGLMFSLINFGLPFAVLALFALVYRLRRVRLRTLAR